MAWRPTVEARLEAHRSPPGLRKVEEAHLATPSAQISPYYTAIMDRVMLTARVSKAGVKRIDELAKAESVERSEMVRRMLACFRRID